MRPTWTLLLLAAACSSGKTDPTGAPTTTGTVTAPGGTPGATPAGTPSTGTPGTATTGTGTGTGTGGATGACTAVAIDTGEKVRVPRFPGQDLVGTDFTIEAWVWIDPANPGFTFLPLVYNDPRDDISGWRLVALGGAGNRTLLFQLGSQQPTLPTVESPPGSLSEGTWHHVAVTFIAANRATSLFIDGAPVGSEVFDQGPASGDAVGDLGLGGVYGGPPYHLIGGLDEVRISTVARYAAPFSPVYEHALDGDTLALWHLDEGTGTIAADAAGTQDGTLDGATWAAGSPCGGAP